MKKQTKLWETADNRRIRICDMSDTHLKNTIRLLKDAAERKVWCYIEDCYAAQNYLNGEMAILSMEQEEARLSAPGSYEEFLPEIYWNMLEDLERREWEAGANRRALDNYKRKVCNE